MLKRSCTVAGAIAAALALTATQATAATLTYSGTGWKINTAEKVKALSPSRQHTVTFSSAAIKTYWAPYLSRMITQLNAMGVKIKVGGVATMSTSACPPKGTIYFTEAYRPLGTAGYSKAGSCVDSAGTQYSGIVWMTSEYRSGARSLSTTLRYNLPTHEILHALGLDHPNYDRDKDGKVEKFECATTSYGNRPLECSPNGGYQTTKYRGTLVPSLDGKGIEALLANARVQGIK